jgi:glycerate kinase
MRIVVAPDSFKGSLSALEAAECIGRAAREVFPDALVELVPIADGGEGTVQAIVAASGGEIIPVTVTGPLGDTVDAYYGLIESGRTAVIEMAAASGLLLVPQDKLNPLVATTFGTGQLLRAALDRGCSRIIMGIGGSATNDGGAGMAEALGARFLDAEGKPVPRGGLGLRALDTIDISQLDPRLKSVDIEVACDVNNPLYGPSGAASVFGPQKGATPEMIALLDEAMQNYAERLQETMDVDVTTMPGGGAAGGLGAGLFAFAGGKLRMGIDIIADLTNLRAKINVADLVITGEGSYDAQTARGKAVLGISSWSEAQGVPVIVFAGAVSLRTSARGRAGSTAVFSITPGPVSLSRAMAEATDNLYSAAREVLLAVRIGQNI